MTNGMMTKDELQASCKALARWFESQDISPADSVPILAATITWVIWHLAKKDSAASETGARIVGEMLAEMIQNTKEIFDP